MQVEYTIEKDKQVIIVKGECFIEIINVINQLKEEKLKECLKELGWSTPEETQKLKEMIKKGDNNE